MCGSCPCNRGIKRACRQPLMASRSVQACLSFAGHCRQYVSRCSDKACASADRLKFTEQWSGNRPGLFTSVMATRSGANGTAAGEHREIEHKQSADTNLCDHDCDGMLFFGRWQMATNARDYYDGHVLTLDQQTSNPISRCPRRRTVTDYGVR